MKFKSFMIAAAATFIGLNGNQASAQDARIDILSGNGFLQECTEDGDDDSYFMIGVCYGFLTGWLDRDSTSYNARMVCRPPTTNNKQIMDMVLKYLRDHPENRHLHISHALVNSLAEAFPCAPEDQIKSQIENGQ